MSHHAATVIKDDQIVLSKNSLWRKLPLISAVVGAIGLGVAFSQLGAAPQRFYAAYLTSYMGFLAFALGGLIFTLIQHATRAGWSIVVRRLAENVMLSLPLMVVLAFPIFMGMHELFHWTHADVVKHDVILKAKAPYLNVQAFSIRAVIYAVVWIGAALMFYRWSVKQDRSADPMREANKMRWFAPLGIVTFALTMTFAALDYLMSLDPHWFSTIFGVYYFAGIMLSAHALLALLALGLQRSGHLQGVVTTEHYHDLGKMMFGFTVFWGYIGFSQYMLYWYASIPEETYWFAYRGHGDWLVLSLVLVFGRFVVPFFLIMSRHVKRNGKLLAFWALWVLAFEFVDMFWLIQPVFGHEHGTDQIHFGLVEVACFFGIGGLWLAMVTWAMGRAPLVPTKDPRLTESLQFENF